MAVLAENELNGSDNIHHEQRNVLLRLGAKDYGSGTLFICDSIVKWVIDGDVSLQLRIPYQCIILHAISREFNEECLYLHLDMELPERFRSSSGSENSSENDCDMEDCADPTELRFIPSDKESLTPMFNLLVHHQSLNSEVDNYSEDECLEDIDEYGPNHPDFFDAGEPDPAIVEELEDMHIGTNGIEHNDELDEDIYQDAPDE